MPPLADEVRSRAHCLYAPDAPLICVLPCPFLPAFMGVLFVVCHTVPTRPDSSPFRHRVRCPSPRLRHSRLLGLPRPHRSHSTFRQPPWPTLRAQITTSESFRQDQLPASSPHALPRPLHTFAPLKARRAVLSPGVPLCHCVPSFRAVGHGVHPRAHRTALLQNGSVSSGTSRPWARRTPRTPKSRPRSTMCPCRSARRCAHRRCPEGNQAGQMSEGWNMGGMHAYCWGGDLVMPPAGMHAGGIQSGCMLYNGVT